MTVTIKREFCPADRYRYDSSLPADFAQIDTSQDASYYGTWASAKRRVIFCYCEGDCTTTQCETDEEFRSEILKIKQWNVDNGHKFLGIDPGWAALKNPAITQPWIDCGLSELLQ